MAGSLFPCLLIVRVIHSLQRHEFFGCDSLWFNSGADGVHSGLQHCAHCAAGEVAGGGDTGADV